MKRYTVEITDDALADMQQLYNYIALNLQSSENAMGQYNRIADAIMKLDIFPERFHIMDLEMVHTKEFRRMSVDNYSIFFTIKNEKVIVTNVLYSASDIEKRLK